MKKPQRKRTLRTLIISALLVTALSCCTAVFFSANAAEDTSQPTAVTQSDAIDETAKDDAPGGNVDEDDKDTDVTQDELECHTVTVSSKDVSDTSHYRFKPNAVYNGSFRSELLANEVTIYDALVQHFITDSSNETLHVDIESMGYTTSDQAAVGDMVLSAYAAFTTDYPMSYWMDGYGSGIWSGDGKIVAVDIEPSERYDGAYSEMATIKSGITSAVNTISASRASSSRYDTVKAIHDYICNTMSYDYDAAETGNYPEAHCIAPLFGGGSRGHQFVCEGYANSFKLLCDKFGVPAVHVKGDAGGAHSWNYVQMENGSWYGVDATWDDQASLLYTYFLVGTNSVVFNGNTFGQDHVPQNQVMVQSTVNPLAYPVLSAKAYTPGDWFDFWGESAQDNREVSGNVEFQWKFVGEQSITNVVDVYLDNNHLATIDIDANGYASYWMDTTDLENGTHTVKAVFTKSGSDSITVTRNIVVSGASFGFLYMDEPIPTLRYIHSIYMKQVNCGSALDCEVQFFVDDNFMETLYCDSEGVFEYDLDTYALSDGEHVLRAVLNFGDNQTRVAEKTVAVANPTLKVLDPEDGSTVSGTVRFEMVQYNFDSSEPCQVDISLDNEYCTTLESSEGEIFYYEVDTTQLTNEYHYLELHLQSPSGEEYWSGVSFIVENYIDPASITLNRESVSIHLGETTKLLASLEPFNATGEITWFSEDESIATVNEKGLVTSVNVGETVIHACSGEINAACTVRVTSPVKYPVTLSKSWVSLFMTNNKYNPTATLKATKPKSIKKVIWYSDDTDVVDVSQSGVITALSSGTANIYCTSEDGEYISAPCKVTVGEFYVYKNEDSPYFDTLNIPIGGNGYMGAYAHNIPGYDDEEAQRKIAWKSSNTKIAKVGSNGYDECEVSGISKGTATVTASIGVECSATYKVTVFASATSLKLNTHSASIYVNKPLTLKATQNKGANDPLYWVCDDPDIAYVTEKGVVYGFNQGTTTIRVYSYDGSAYDEATITVRTPANSIDWYPSIYGLNPRSAVKRAVALKDVLDLKVEIYDPYMCNDTITWTTSNKSVVGIHSIVNDGKCARLVGLKKGSATITAKTGSGKKISYLVTVVTQAADSITLNKHEANLYIRSSLSLTAKTTPKGNNDVITWVSTNPYVATVDENGKVTAVSQGETEIYAISDSSGEVRDYATIHVLTKANSLTWGTLPENITPAKTVKYGVPVGGTKELSAVITSPEGCNDIINWTTSSKAVVAIIGNPLNTSGVTVQGLKKGTATITAKTGSGKSVTYQITVVPSSAQQLVINKHEVSIYKGSSLSLSAQVLPKGCNDVVLWKSSNSNIARVDENGKVTAVEQGDAVITAYSATSGDVLDTAAVQVRTKAVSITWSDIPVNMKPAKTVKHSIPVTGTKELGVIITSPEDCNDSVNWSTNNKSVVAITSSASNVRTITVQGLKKGTATITAKSGSGKAITYQITVVPEGAQQFVLNKHEANVYKGSSLALSAKVLPKGCNDVVIWKSSNPDVATVDENGKVTAVGQGDAVITAYSETSDVPNDTATVHVLTKATKFTWVNIPDGMMPKSAVKYGVLVGQSKELYSVITAPENCNDTITWTTSNKSIVAINEYLDNNSGVRITALKKGTATITAKTGSGCKIIYTINAVSESAQSIVPSKNSVSLYQGSAVSISTKITPKTSNDTLLWKSENPSIASVDETGKITANYYGTTVIKVYSSTSEEVMELISVNVISRAQFVDIKATEITLVQGRSVQVDAVVLPERYHDNLTWSSSSKGVISITPVPESSSAIISGLKPGTTKLTVKTGSGKSRTIPVTIKKGPVYDSNNVNLTLWGEESDQQFLTQTANEWASAYKAEHPNYKSVKVSVSIVGADVATYALDDPSVVGADVFTTAADTCLGLIESGKILELPETVVNETESLVGSALMESACYQGRYYGIPSRFEAANVLYYNKNLYTQEEITNLNTMLAKDLNGTSNLMMDLNSVWYGMNWFSTAGARLYTNYDKSINTMNNPEVVEMMKWLAERHREGTIAGCADDSLAAQAMGDGTAAAVIAGPWCENEFRDRVGDDLGIAELPYITVPNSVTNQHMYCFTNSKITAVNAQSFYPEAALSLAQYLTNESNQLRRFEMTGAVPTAESLVSNSAVLSDPLAKAQVAQKNYTVFSNAYLGRANYWGLCETFLADLLGRTLSDETIEMLYADGFTEEQIMDIMTPHLSDEEIAQKLNEIVDEMQNNF